MKINRLTLALISTIFLLAVLANQRPLADTIKPLPVIDRKTKESSLPAASKESGFYVFRVVDGDTIITIRDNQRETVRLIGIDAPERAPSECFAKEATEFTKALLWNKQVFLESDPSQADRDKYQRLLRYVFLTDGQNFNKLAIASGYAREYRYKAAYKYEADFKAAEAEAKSKKLGIWSTACMGSN